MARNRPSHRTLARIRTKSCVYLDFLNHGGLGPDHVPPRVLFTTPDTPRADAINKIITRLSTHDSHFIDATTHTEATPVLDQRITYHTMKNVLPSGNTYEIIIKEGTQI